MWRTVSSPVLHRQVTAAWSVPPSGQAAAPLSNATPAPTPPAFCASLPSSDSARMAVSGDPIGWLRVGRDVVFRGLLVGVGMYLYDPKDPKLLQRALAGSVGIEAFVLLWTWGLARQAAASAANPPTGR